MDARDTHSTEARAGGAGPATRARCVVVSDEFRPATPRVAAGLLFRDGQGNVLLVKPTYKSGWDLPGGYVEPGESPKQAAKRELREELGVDREVGPLLVVDWAPHPAEGDKVLFIFDAGSLALNEITRNEDELGDVAYVAIEDLAKYLPDRLLERVRSALTADLRDRYLEHGRRAT